MFYIDVGNMPTVKAEQYVRDIMVKYRNKLVYDSNTGEIKDDRKHLSMLEDFWLPRREGSKGTEISTLEGARNLGELEDVKYFQSKLYRSLNVPIGRLEPQQGFSLGRSTEITRDELKFTKFIERLRNKFSILFDDLLRVQLVLKKVCTEEEWKEFKEDIFYDFKKDNNFDELKDAELMTNRFTLLAAVDPFVGKYVSIEWVRKNILQQSDEDMEEINGQMEQENAVLAQQQAQQMQAQQDQQMQDQQNQLALQGQQQIQQAAIQQEIDKNTEEQPVSKNELINKDHESKMMDKKIELEKIKNKKPVAKTPSKKPAPKKKTVAKEARDLGLVYVGNNQYTDPQGSVRFINENGILVELNKDSLID